MQLLEERLAHYKALEHDDSRLGSEQDDEENINPFYNARRRAPTEEGSSTSTKSIFPSSKKGWNIMCSLIGFTQ